MNSKTSSLSVRINSDLKQKVVQDAQKLEMSLTEYIEFILTKVDSIDSESMLSESFAEKLKSIFENISVLDEINEISHKNFQKNTEILQAVGAFRVAKEEVENVEEVEEVESLIITDKTIISRIFRILGYMERDEIRYEKDGESTTGEVKTPHDVLNIIVNQYYSLLMKNQ